LKVVKVSTGNAGGFVTLPDGGVIVANVVEDDPDNICEDDCDFSKEGRCDDVDVVGRLRKCDWGHDCYDCGPRARGGQSNAGPHDVKTSCDDSCGERYVKDGICDDGRPGSWNNFCELGTDCSDCGPVPEEGFDDYATCTNGNSGSSAEERVPGLLCVFPFTYKGVKYDSCVPDTETISTGGNWGWCPVTDSYETDGKWGSCQYCVDVRPDEFYALDGDDESYDVGGGGHRKKKNRDKKTSTSATTTTTTNGAALRFVQGVAFLSLVAVLGWGGKRVREWSLSAGAGGSVQYGNLDEFDDDLDSEEARLSSARIRPDEAGKFA
jgi:hypothetical protein